MTPDSDTSVIVVLVRDLIFSTKISAEAKAAGVSIRLVRSTDAAATTAGRKLIVDLGLPGAIAAAAGWKAAHGGEVIAYVSHIDADSIAQAKAAGLDRVLPRSRFVELLPEILRSDEGK